MHTVSLSYTGVGALRLQMVCCETDLLEVRAEGRLGDASAPRARSLCHAAV